MSGARELLDSEFPHGTPEGWRRGCRSSACPALMSCRDVYQRYSGDYRFKVAVDSGVPAWEIAARESEESAAREREAELARRAARAAEREEARAAAAEGRRQERAAERAAAAEERRAERQAEVEAHRAEVEEGMRRLVAGWEAAFAEQAAKVEALRVELAEAERQLAEIRRSRPKAVKAPPAPRGPRQPRAPRAPRVSKPRELKPHGTNAAYARGCRCDECKEANRVYHRDYVARRRAAGVPAEHHGTPYGYQLGCRSREACPAEVSCADVSLAGERRRRREAGIPELELVAAEPVRDHIRGLMAAGVSLLSLAERAGVSRSVLKTLLYGRSGERKGELQAHVKADTAERLLVVRELSDSGRAES